MQEKRTLKTISLLSQRQASALNRKRIVVNALKGTSVILEDASYLSFVSNDYLGLSQHPSIIQAYQNAINLYGVGSVSSPLLGGYTKAHQLLEEELADFSGFPRTLLFSSGYMANLAIISSFFTKQDRVFSDRHNHASLIDAIRFSSAKLLRFPHLDMECLKKLIANTNTNTSASTHTSTSTSTGKNSETMSSHQWIVVEGVYSVDGDISPLPIVEELAKANAARLILDDAHAFGVLGKQGRGTLAHYAMATEAVSLVSGSFSKAFGCFGAFVGAEQNMIEALIQFARPYIYSTALPAALVESLRVSLRLLMKEEWRREKLLVLITQFRKGAEQLGIPLLPSVCSSQTLSSVQTFTPIQIILIGDSKKTVLIHEFMRSKGILVGALRPPTVAFGQDRLRITLSALHTVYQIDQLLLALEEAMQQGYLEKDGNIQKR